ncbi:MAG TPA: hypothetical protein VMS08_03570 [Candidatus Saccharimonadia bacterium]|nr:hypothetical protein [Candidatus Saccharimonadia bacterium]
MRLISIAEQFSRPTHEHLLGLPEVAAAVARLTRDPLTRMGNTESHAYRAAILAEAHALALRYPLDRFSLAQAEIPIPGEIGTLSATGATASPDLAGWAFNLELLVETVARQLISDAKIQIPVTFVNIMEATDKEILMRAVELARRAFALGKAGTHIELVHESWADVTGIAGYLGAFFPVTTSAATGILAHVVATMPKSSRARWQVAIEAMARTTPSIFAPVTN